MAEIHSNHGPLYRLDFQIPFHRIDAAGVVPTIQALLGEARAAMEALAADPAPRTYENTLAILDQFTDPLDQAVSVVRHLESVATTPELRAAVNEMEPLVSEFYSSIPLHAGLWSAVRAAAAHPSSAQLDPVRRRFLDKTIESFRRHGADLDDAGKQRLREIDIELTRLTTKFSENLLDSTNAFEYVITDADQLAGLPPSAIAAARQSAESKGIEGWRFTLQAPSYNAVLDHLDDRGIRERFYRANIRRAAEPPFDNRAIAERVIELRRAKAQQLGYFNFADFVLEDRMAKRGERARDFLREIARHTEFHFQQEQQELAHFAAGTGGPAKLEPWDISYYAEKLRKARFDLDDEELRPYFALDHLMAGMYEFAARLFGVRVVRVDAPGWDPGVECYHLLDAAAGTLLGSFYTDWFPRENKRGGAWMDALRTGGPQPDGSFRPHIGLICGNLTPPIGGKPALLTHLEVETIFHEFGHLLHHCLSQVPVRSLAGTNVAWDFVELPSQILENWCWEREALALFARHYETGEPVPAALHEKMVRARNFRVAHAQMRQLGFGLMDLKIHMDYEAKHWREETGGDLVDYTRGILQPYSPAELPPDHATILSFSHLFSSPVAYAAGYYSYKWADVLAADVFSRFLAEGVFNPETGMAFRRQVLERGDSADPGELFRALMGRDPDSRALLRRQGLLLS